MELSELKSKAFDIRAEIDKIDAGIQKANEQKAKLINDYNPVAQEIFKLENEAKKEPDIKPSDRPTPPPPKPKPGE